METLRSAFGDLFKEASAVTQAVTHITPENVYQPAVPAVRPCIDKLVGSLALSGSGITGVEHLHELHEKARAGASCLILPEHYSNTDLPCIATFLRKDSPASAEIAEDLVAIAGMKLNEQNPQLAALASAFSRIVICPSRYLELYNGEKKPDERLRVIQINRASMRKLNEIKTRGKLILVFPSGTRYRPGQPETKRGVREIDSYIKSFDYMCLVAVNGQLLTSGANNMIDDTIQHDVVRLTASPVISCAEFRGEAKRAAEAAGVDDKKQAVADAIMARLEEMHAAAEPERKKILAAGKGA